MPTNRDVDTLFLAFSLCGCGRQTGKRWRMRGHAGERRQQACMREDQGDLAREKEGWKKSRWDADQAAPPAQQCSTTTGCRSVHPSVRSWTTVHHTGTLPSKRRSSTRSGLAELGASRSQTKMEARVDSLRVLRISLSLSLSLSLFLFLSAVQVLSSRSWPRRCNEWKRSGLPGGSRKFNFDRRGDR